MIAFERNPNTGEQFVVSMVTAQRYGVSITVEWTDVASSSEDGFVKLWNPSDGALITHMVHNAAVIPVRFSFDSQAVVSGSTDRTIRSWDTSNGHLVRQIGAGGLYARARPVAGVGRPLALQDSQSVTHLAAYSGSQIRLKRPYTWRPKCGDGVVDEGEAFDNGQPWVGGDTPPNVRYLW